LAIQFLANKDINYQRWNNCIQKSYNGNVFGYTWYLNILDDDWYGIIEDDYKTVMPVFAYKKYNRLIGYTPELGSQFGIYSQQILSTQKTNEFIDLLNKKLSAYHIHLNKFNTIRRTDIQVKHVPVYELDLIKPYKKIFYSYDFDTRKKIQQAEKNNISILNGLRPSEFINFLYKEEKNLKFEVETIRIARLRLLISTALRYRMGQMMGAYTRENTLCAVAFLVWGKNKIHLKFLASNQIGIDEKAIYLLLDHYVKGKSEKNLILSMEPGAFIKHPDLFKEFGTIEAKSQVIIKKKNNWFRLKR
jgi:hypothetical protein